MDYNARVRVISNPFQGILSKDPILMEIPEILIKSVSFQFSSKTWFINNIIYKLLNYSYLDITL